MPSGAKFELEKDESSSLQHSDNSHWNSFYQFLRGFNISINIGIVSQFYKIIPREFYNIIFSNTQLEKPRLHWRRENWISHPFG